MKKMVKIKWKEIDGGRVISVKVRGHVQESGQYATTSDRRHTCVASLSLPTFQVWTSELLDNEEGMDSMMMMMETCIEVKGHRSRGGGDLDEAGRLRRPQTLPWMFRIAEDSDEVAPEMDWFRS